MRDLFATPSRHKKRCDMMLCTGNSKMEFSRTNSTAGRLDLCQSCIDEIAKYATPKQEDVFPCQYCGKEIKSKIGLSSHEKACKENPSNKSE